MLDKKCKRCHKMLKLIEFQKDGREYNNCHDCRRKMREYRSKQDPDENKKQCAKYKAENKERTKLMNLFYATTKNCSNDEKKILKEKFQKEHGITSTVLNKPSKHRKEHSFHNEIEGKECSVPNCGWHPLTEYNNSSLNWDGLRKTCKKCLQEDRKKNRARMNEYHRKKIIEDKNFCIRQRIKVRIHTSMNKIGFKKNKSTEEILGCTIQKFKEHLESQFKPGMSWDNCGFFINSETNTKNIGWHIDHIIPCSSWDLTNPKEILLCFNYRNCSPMWGQENLSKCDKYDPQDKINYIEKMKDIFKDDLHDKLIDDILKEISDPIADIQQKKEDEKKKKMILENYIEDQYLEGMRILFYNAENPPNKEYSSSVYSRMMNQGSRKSGAENSRSKKVEQYSITDNQLIQTFDSLTEAGKSIGISYVNISKCIHGKYKTAGGFIWKYKS